MGQNNMEPHSVTYFGPYYLNSLFGTLNLDP